MNLLNMKCVSSLAKVFPDTELEDKEYKRGSVFKGEVFSFQVAYRAERMVKRLHVRIDTGKLAVKSMIRSVGLVPSEMPTYGDEDDFVLRNTPGFIQIPCSRQKMRRFMRIPISGGLFGSRSRSRKR